MAKRMILVDDLDNTESTDIKTRLFSLDGADFEIDLNSKNMEKLRSALAPFTAAARKPSRPMSAKPKSKSSPNSEQLKAIREWAWKNGFDKLSDRGRIPQDVEDAFNAAMAKNGTAKKTPANA